MAEERLEFSSRPIIPKAPSTDGYDNNSEASFNSAAHTVGQYNTAIRHGFGVISSEWMEYLAENFWNYFEDKRHDTGGRPANAKREQTESWRIADRHRTVNAALVLCLNLGVDPPDIIKTQPCAKMEAWINPTHITDTKKAIEQIGKNLQAQYETLSTRTKYKQCLDPNVEDAKRFCMGLRRSAREERILFHYNGHGVPRPTRSGEIWVFNRGYTQYIPVSVYELQTWLGAPVIYCYDCSGAGHIVNNFLKFVEKRKAEEQKGGQRDPAATPAASYEMCIQMAACRADEILPMHPKLPADMFTCCITTPVEIAVKWFVTQNNTLLGLDPEKTTIPGKVTDRRTPLGELNWIFTAITDTIAWSALDTPLFKRLFRQDLVVAAMFRNFLLAVRIMRVHNCHPISHPELPDTHAHPLWASWDLAVNQCLLQLPAIQKAEQEGKTYNYQYSDFFEQQLTAFETWLQYKYTDLSHPPQQLPVLLQVLLSQIHRLRALVLLSRYLDLGPEAVHIALSIGFFIYVLKLLQSPAPELKPVLVFIWARIMAVEAEDVQHELVKENGYSYFVNILTQNATSQSPELSGDSDEFEDESTPSQEHLAMCAFILAQFCRNYMPGQRLCAVPELFSALSHHMARAESPLLRQWCCLCGSQLLEFSEARDYVENHDDTFVREMIERLRDPIPEVRAAALAGLTPVCNESIAGYVVEVALDASPIMRREAIVFFSRLVYQNMGYFLVCAYTTLEEDFVLLQERPARSDSPAVGTTWLSVWRVLLVLTLDPDSSVKHAAEDVVDYVYMKLNKTPLGGDVQKIADYILGSNQTGGNDRVPSPSPQSPPKRVVSGPIAHQHALAPSTTNGQAPNGRASNGSRPSMVRSASAPLIETVNRKHQQQQQQANGGYAPVNSMLRYARTWLRGNSESPSSQIMAETSKPNETWPIPPSSGEVEHEIDAEIVLPIKSTFYDWSIEYFTEPQLRGMENEEAGSRKYLERMWRKGRNEQILSQTQIQKDLAVTGTWNNVLCTVKASHTANKVAFAQFEPHLVVSGVTDHVTVFDWSSGARLNTFSNGNISGTHIEDLKFLNEDDHPMLLTASNDGMARVYKSYDSLSEIELVCSWWLLADIVPSRRLPPIKIEWQQSRGALLVGGDIPIIRVWDAAREQSVDDIPVRTASRLTSLTSDQVTGNLVIAGFQDGSVHFYDRRLPKQESHIRHWHCQNAPIINARMQRGGPREIMTGSSDGTVCLWDIRSSDPVVKFQAHTKEMNCLDMHEHAPVIVTASRIIGIWSTGARRVATVRPPASYMTRAEVVNSVNFHPHRIMMAAATGDIVNVFQCI